MLQLGLGRQFLAKFVGVVLAAVSVSATGTLEPMQLAIIVNDRDPVSVETAAYYAKERRIPAGNIIHIELPPEKPRISAEKFKAIYEAVRRATPATIQAYALTWAQPFKVDCMSITSAFAFGYSPRYCAKGCRATAPNPYFDDASTRPYDDFGLRPTMAIAARSVENAKLVIDRGIQSDFTNPRGKAYLLITPEKSRSSRVPKYTFAQQELASRVPISIVRSTGINKKYDIMFYFTGAKTVPYLDTVGFLPGAIADHLTSAGGRLTNSKQMSALRWLEAGATGSYGTVVEPCNFPQKFPDPKVAIEHYLNGDTLIEAYWKSVSWPGQGIFIGEPLAKPFALDDSETASPLAQ